MSRRLIAEIGAAKGDLQYALDCVDAFAAAGAWAIKGQLYTADSLVRRGAATYGKDLDEPATQYEAFTKALTYDQWGEVKTACDKAGVKFFGSVFDYDAVDAGVEQGWEYFKIASADITYRGLLERVAATGKHVFLSTGGATMEEIKRAADLFDTGKLTVLACTLSYPCKLENADVARVTTLKRFYARVGYSDHTRGRIAAECAYQYGATVVEKHATLTPGDGGDHDFAITLDVVSALLAKPYITVIDARVEGWGRIGPKPSERSAILLARRSPYATQDIVLGETIDETNTVMLRPATGVPPFDLPLIATSYIKKGSIITYQGG